MNPLRPRPRPIRNALADQAMRDNAPVGSVGAPGGVLGAQPAATGKNHLRSLLGAASLAPGIGDAMGLIGDAAMYASDPSSRTWPNALMTGLGALPFVPSAQQLAELAGPLSAMVVYHGSPHKFDAFDMSKIGTGEGAQAYGHGLYLAESPEVAGSYRDIHYDPRKLDNFYAENMPRRLTTMERAKITKAAKGDEDIAQAALSLKASKESLRDIEDGLLGKAIAESRAIAKGNLYTVDLPDEAIAKMLDWDKPLSEQPQVAQAVIHQRLQEKNPALYKTWSENGALEHAPLGSWINQLAPNTQTGAGARAALSESLRQAGIPGIRYLDGGSRSGGKGTRNFVVFDDKLPKILKRE